MGHRGILGRSAVALVVIIAMQSVENGRAESAARASELVQDLAAKLSDEQDEAQKAKLTEEFNAAVEKAASYQGTFGAQQAWFASGQLSMKNGDWKKAAEDFIKAWETKKKGSYLAPLALMQAAAAAEEAGDLDQALARYKTLIKDYSGQVPGIPRIHFSVGRILEAKQDWTGAKAAYDELAVAFPGDDWTNLANSRIISLKAKGLAQ
jgi:tetratricopeptide (TPR) repeat protein